MIPIYSPIPQYRTLKDSLDKALTEVAASGQYILGPQVAQFEEEFAASVGTEFAVGLNSGTDALLLALKALQIGPGDEVITTCFSFIATSEAVVRTGARPVFVDVDPVTFNLDLEAVKRAITERTKAVIPVHLYGQAVDMTELMAIAEKHNLWVIEDCAQAAGATWHGQQVGSFGHFGCFSFFPTKNLGALGDAGAVTTNDPALADMVKSLRVHGPKPENRYDHVYAGINSRLDTMQAAVLLVKLPHLETWNTERRRIAQYYTEQIQNSELAKFVDPPAVSTMMSQHVFHQYTIKLKTTDPAIRDAVQSRMRDGGAMAMIYYPIPLHLQKTHANLGYKPGDFPVAEQLASQVLSLPMYPGLTRDEQDIVLNALKQAVVASGILQS